MGKGAASNKVSKEKWARALSENLWLPVQIVALVAILFSTVLAGTHPTPPKENTTESDTVEAPSAFQKTSVALPKESRPRSITSRVVVLPAPEQASISAGLSVEIETRQLRFERNPSNSVSLRSPASRASSPKWKLARIRKRAGGAWESVPLIENESNQPLGSVFIELDEGWNEFEVLFRDGRGREASYPVRVNHVRKNTT